GHAGRLQLSRHLERLPVAAHRPERRAQVHAAGGAGEPGRRARAGHRADDGRRGGDRGPGADPVPGPAALVHPGCADGERERVRRRAPPPAAIAAGLLLAWSAAAPAAAAAGPAAARPATATPAAGTPVLIDDFEDASRWSAHPADGVAMKLSAQGAPGARALRIDFGFAG